MNDRCAACFELLRDGPMGSRYACRCNPPNNFRSLRGSYWSEVPPEWPHAATACVWSKHGKPTLHFYGVRLPK